VSIKETLKTVLATRPQTESAVRKRYHLPQLYRTKALARVRSPPYSIAAPDTDDPAKVAEIDRIGREIGVYVDEYMSGSMYNPPLHPAFSGFPADRASEVRYDLLADNIDASGGRVLDVGCHIGAYFASRLDDDGFDAIALDENVVHAYFSKRLTALRNPDVRVIWDSLFTWPGRHGPFDVVLGFNVFHHMLKERRLFDRLKRWFVHVQAEEMFIQIPDQETPMWEGVCDWLTGDEWVNLILGRSDFDSADCLGRPSNDRPMYHFRTLD
jgi:hypothetical protein